MKEADDRSNRGLTTYTIFFQHGLLRKCLSG